VLSWTGRLWIDVDFHWDACWPRTETTIPRVLLLGQ